MFTISISSALKSDTEALNPRELSASLKLPSLTADVNVEDRDDPAVSTAETFAVDTAKIILKSTSKLFVDDSSSFEANEPNERKESTSGIDISVTFVMMTSPRSILVSPSSTAIDS
jgi:hypothetical protein